MSWRKPIPGLYRHASDTAKSQNRGIYFGIAATMFFGWAIFIKKGEGIEEQRNRFNYWMNPVVQTNNGDGNISMTKQQDDDDDAIQSK